MTEIKFNNSKFVFDDNGLKVTDNNVTHPERYISIDHDGYNAVKTIGFGEDETEHILPETIADNGSIDLPANTAGFGTITIGDNDEYATFTWSTDNTVVLVDASNNVSNVDSSGYYSDFCIYDNTTSVRMTNYLGAAKRVMFDLHYTETAMAPTFAAFYTPSGVDNLDTDIYPGKPGSYPPIFRYKGGDADATNWDAWGYGDTLTLQAGTAPSYNQGSPGLGSNDDSVKFNNGGYYRNNAITNQLSTYDLAFEIVFKPVQNGSSDQWLMYFFGSDGVLFRYNHSTQSVSFNINDSGGNVTVSSATSSCPYNEWCHVIVFVDRDESSTEGSQIYVNGIASGTGVDMSAISGSLASATLSIGSSSGSNYGTSNVAYCALWHIEDIWDGAGYNSLQWRHIALTRFTKLIGVYPQVFTTGSNILPDGDMEAAGTSVWAEEDSTLAKDTTAPLYGGTQHLRITSTDHSFYAWQTGICTAGRIYQMTGAARSVDGVSIPRVIVGGSGIAVWTGTTSTSWQTFNVTVLAPGHQVYIGSGSNHPGEVDFDSVVFTNLDGLPNIQTRAFAAYLDKVENGYRKLYYVGSHWLRMCHRIDSSNRNCYGYLPETQDQNAFTYSEAFTNWTKGVVADVVTDNAVVCPDGRVAAASFAMDNTNVYHSIRLSVTLTAATYAYSVYVKPGSDPTYGKNWIALYDTTTTNYCYFDVANGTVGTATNCTGYIEGPFYGGFYRCIIVFTGTAVSHALRIYIGDANGDLTTFGDGSTPNIYVWGAQCELGDYATSPIITSGAAATRIYDRLRYTAGDNIGGEDVGQGTIVYDSLYSDYDMGTSRQGIYITDGGAATDKLLTQVYNAADRQRIDTRENGGTTYSIYGPAGEIVDDLIHELRYLWGSTTTVYTDGVAGTPTAGLTMPDDLDTLDIGGAATTLSTNGLIAKLRLYPEQTEKG